MAVSDAYVYCGTQSEILRRQETVQKRLIDNVRMPSDLSALDPERFKTEMGLLLPYSAAALPI